MFTQRGSHSNGLFAEKGLQHLFTWINIYEENHTPLSVIIVSKDRMIISYNEPYARSKVENISCDFCDNTYNLTFKHHIEKHGTKIPKTSQGKIAKEQENIS